MDNLRLQVYKNLFVDNFLIKFNFITFTGKPLNFYVFFNLLVREKLVQLFSFFLVWLVSPKNLNLKHSTKIVKSRVYALSLKPTCFINFFFRFSNFLFFKDDFLKEFRGNVAILTNTTLVNGSSFFYLLKHFFDFSSYKLAFNFFKTEVLILKNKSFWKEDFIKHFLSFYNI